MFTTRKTGTDEAAIEARMRELEASNDTWFDNTIESVDRRIAKVDSVRAKMRGALAAGESDQLVTSAHLMDKVAVELTGLRAALLESDLGQELPKLIRGSREEIMALPVQAKQFVEVDGPRFLQANLDAANNPLELSIRAHDHATVATSAMLDLSSRERQVLTAYFTDEVVRGAIDSQPPVSRVAAAPARDVDELPDDLLWS